MNLTVRRGNDFMITSSTVISDGNPELNYYEVYDILMRKLQHYASMGYSVEFTQEEEVI